MPPRILDVIRAADCPVCARGDSSCGHRRPPERRRSRVAAAALGRLASGRRLSKRVLPPAPKSGSGALQPLLADLGLEQYGEPLRAQGVDSPGAAWAAQWEAVSAIMPVGPRARLLREAERTLLQCAAAQLPTALEEYEGALAMAEDLAAQFAAGQHVPRAELARIAAAAAQVRDELAACRAAAAAPRGRRRSRGLRLGPARRGRSPSGVVMPLVGSGKKSDGDRLREICNSLDALRRSEGVRLLRRYAAAALPCPSTLPRPGGWEMPVPPPHPPPDPMFPPAVCVLAAVCASDAAAARAALAEAAAAAAAASGLAAATAAAPCPAALAARLAAAAAVLAAAGTAPLAAARAAARRAAPAAVLAAAARAAWEAQEGRRREAAAAAARMEAERARMEAERARVDAERAAAARARAADRRGAAAAAAAAAGVALATAAAEEAAARRAARRASALQRRRSSSAQPAAAAGAGDATASLSAATIRRRSSRAAPCPVVLSQSLLRRMRCRSGEALAAKTRAAAVALVRFFTDLVGLQWRWRVWRAATAVRRERRLRQRAAAQLLAAAARRRGLQRRWILWLRWRAARREQRLQARRDAAAAEARAAALRLGDAAAGEARAAALQLSDAAAAEAQAAALQLSDAAVAEARAAARLRARRQGGRAAEALAAREQQRRRQAAYCRWALWKARSAAARSGGQLAGARAAADEAAARARRRLAAALAQRAEQRLRARVWRRWALRAAEKRWSALYRKQRAAEPRRPLCGGALPRHLWAKLAREVKAGSVHALAVRGLLRGVSTLAAANAVLRAAEAVSIGGKGDLQLDLLTPEDGALPERWGRTAEIAYDAFGNCPLQVGSVVAAAASEPAVARIAGLCSAAQAPAGLGECVEGRIACVATGRLLVVRSTVSGASCTVDGRPHALPCGFSVGGGGLLLRFPAPANARPIAAAAPPGDAALGLQLTALSRAVATAAAFGDEAAARCSLPVAVPAADAAAALEAPPAELQADLCVAAPIASQDGGGGFDLHCARRPPPLRSGDAVRRNRLMWPGGNADGGGAGAVELTTDGGAAAWVIWTATGARLLYAWGRQDRYHIAPAEAPLPQAWSARVRFSRIERRSGFALGPDGAAVLASVIALGVPIRRIALANHRLGRSGAAHLLGAVRKNHNVRQVYMRDPASADPDYAAACCALELLCASRRRTLPMTLLLRTCVADCWPSAVAAALHEEPEWPLPLPDMCAAHRDAARLCYDELRARRSAATPAVGQLGLLCVASWRSDTPGEARRLLEAGADPAERDTGGRLPLHYAASEPAWGQHPDGLGALRALCAVPGAPAAVDSSGATPLHRACRHGAPESAIALLEALRQQEGAAALAGLLRVRDKQGRTPLYLATENPLYCGAAGAVGALCGAEGVLSIADSDGWTPLHSACFHLHSGTVRILLDLGADPCARDGDGDPPLVAAEQVSQRQGREAGAAVVAMLRSAMAAAARP